MTNANTHARANRAARSGRMVPNVAAELRRLTARDRWLLDLLAEHQVFSTEHVAALGFDNLHTARNRLTLLARREVLARFRDCVRPGSQQWRWTLGWVGACWIASRGGQPTPNRSTIADRVNRLAANPRLAHLLGVNGFFVDLAAYARHTPNTRLDTWWSERTCRQVTGELARPDAYGQWTEHGTTVSFWLEYDRGSEPAHRVLSKLDGYAALHRAAGLERWVLVWLSSPRREASLRDRLATHPGVTSGALTVATASGATVHSAGPVWAPAGATSRRRLSHLAAMPGD